MEKMYDELIQEYMDAITDEQCKKLCEITGVDPTDPNAKRFFAISSFFTDVMDALFGGINL